MMDRYKAKLCQLLGLSAMLTVWFLLACAPARAESMCTQNYEHTIWLLRALVHYHESGAEVYWSRARAEWQYLKNLDLYITMEEVKLNLDPPASLCDGDWMERESLANGVYEILALGNGSEVQTANGLAQAQVDLSEGANFFGPDSNCRWPIRVTGLSSVAGLNGAFFEWLLQRLQGMFSSNHYSLNGVLGSAGANWLSCWLGDGPESDKF